MSAGISLRSLGNGLVPVWEEHAARQDAGHSLDQWYALEPLERAFVVAQFRVGNAMKNLQAEAEIRKSRQEARKGTK